MRRREFIAALGGAAAMSLVARAQQAAMPVVGILRAPDREGASRIFWPRFVLASTKPAASKARRLRSNIALPTASSTDCRCWQPISCGARSR